MNTKTKDKRGASKSNKLTAQVRQELQRIPMPDKNWEDKIYAKATLTEDKRMANSIVPTTGSPKSATKSAAWQSGQSGQNEQNGLGANLARAFIPTILSASFLALVLFLQPINTLYSQFTSASHAQSLAYLEEMVAYDPILDATPDTPAAEASPETSLATSLDDSFFTGTQ